MHALLDAFNIANKLQLAVEREPIDSGGIRLFN